LVERGVVLNHALRETQIIFAREKYYSEEVEFVQAMRRAEFPDLIEIWSKEAANDGSRS
jgi:hypothetical protein